MSQDVRRNAVLDALSQGEYTYASQHLTGQNRTANAHNALDVCDNSGGSTDRLLTWVRLKAWTQSAATDSLVTCALIKLAPSETLPSWTTQNIQKLRDEGKLFFLKTVFQPKASVSGAREFEIEKFNVKLRVGEKLQLSTIFSAACADAVWTYILEKRELNIGA